MKINPVQINFPNKDAVLDNKGRIWFRTVEGKWILQEDLPEDFPEIVDSNINAN